MNLDYIKFSKYLENAMNKKNIISRKVYEKELTRLQFELVKLQEWIKDKKLKVIVIFEGRDTAGKSGTIKRITQSLNARVCRIAALPIPNKREQNQWYFQRFVAQFPAEGEMVLFDRSWYNRAGIEKVMSFCTDKQYENFLETCPAFEKLLIDSDIILIKYWFSISQQEQEKRLLDRSQDPIKRWKLGTIDIASRAKWDEYTNVRDRMFESTDTDISPWYIIKADIKKHARINCISHLLSKFKYEDLQLKSKYLSSVKMGKNSKLSGKKFNIVPDIAKKLKKIR